MDFDKLREDLIEENRDKELLAEIDVDDTGDLPALLRNQATRIRGRFTEATDTGERNRLRERYQKLDAWMSQWQATERLPEPERKPRQDALRAAVLEDMRGWNLGAAQVTSEQQKIDLGHKHLKEQAKPGALTGAHKRIKDEIEYLLRNYTPSNESKIETLIDKWRRSGDPNYDPSIRTRLRNARRKKNDSDYAL